MDEKHVGLLGATSLVGQCLLRLLGTDGWRVTAFSRRHIISDDTGVRWLQLESPDKAFVDTAKPHENIFFWICVAPLWVLPDYFPMLEKYGARRVIAVSSTSRFTKGNSSSEEEKRTASRLTEAETRLAQWTKGKDMTWLVLRPTLIYGLGLDKNISEISRLVCRFGFFPLLGRAKGLRQPVHAEDVATVCLSALKKADVANRSYNLSGGETLTYREMVIRIFTALGRRPKLVEVPLWLFKLTTVLLRCFPRYRHWTVQMAERMDTDLVFDHADAVRDLNYSPGKFQLDSKDLPH